MMVENTDIEDWPRKKHNCKTVVTFKIQIYVERNVRTQVCYSFEEILSKHEGKGKEERERIKSGESRSEARG